MSQPLIGGRGLVALRSSSWNSILAYSVLQTDHIFRGDGLADRDRWSFHLGLTQHALRSLSQALTAECIASLTEVRSALGRTLFEIYAATTSAANSTDSGIATV